MSFSSNALSSPIKWVEGEFVGSKPTVCVCNLSIMTHTHTHNARVFLESKKILMIIGIYCEILLFVSISMVRAKGKLVKQILKKY